MRECRDRQKKQNVFERWQTALVCCCWGGGDRKLEVIQAVTSVNVVI